MASIERKNVSSPDVTKTPFEKGVINTLSLNGLVLNSETLQPGWKWSKHVKPVVGTDSCQKFHVKYILSGKQMVVMDDGTQVELVAGDFAVIQPGHDAWVVGDDPNVLLELSGMVPQQD